MNYLALGDSMSIDEYTGIVGGGAASQFAHRIAATEFQNLTYDGCTTAGVLANLERISSPPDVITLTAGGNDFLLAAFSGSDPATPEGWMALVDDPLDNLRRITDRLSHFGCPLIMNTIYDPTEGSDTLGQEIGLSTGYRSA